ncbi:MAG: Na+/H+ antiporter NhaC family protein [Pseudomonadota bacterium]
MLSRALLAVFVLLTANSPATGAEELTLETPEILLSGVGFEVTVGGLDGAGHVELRIDDQLVATSPGPTVAATDLQVVHTGSATIAVFADGELAAERELDVIPGWVSLFPPLFAILLAFLVRAVIPALFAGILVGAWAINGMTLPGFVEGFFETVTIYIINAATDPDHMAIMVFTLMIGGMVGIISRNGGMLGAVNKIIPLASTPKRAQGVVAALGLGIFFDDYANTMIVGNATRPMTDTLRISREKLAYIVDSTAAPVATVAIITTWIGFQLGLIDTAIADIPAIEQSAYALFLNSILYSFYPFLAIFFVFLVIYTGKDFGPMYTAERRARETGAVRRTTAAKPNSNTADDFAQKADIPCRAVNAVVPILTMIGTVVAGLFVSGEGETLTDIIGSADAYKVLIWASLLACFVAAALTLGQKLMSLEETVEAFVTGARFMLTGLILLVMAWAIADVASVLQAAPYLISILGDALSPYMLPTVVFLLAAGTAFATGTSWGVMAILMPLVIPLCWAVLQANGMAEPEHMHILYSCIACVLTGAVWADHCSPISDTTVLSSLATDCNHMDHVSTQIPYALIGGVVAIFVGVLPAGYGIPWFLLLPSALVVLVVIHRFLGKPTEG